MDSQNIDSRKVHNAEDVVYPQSNNESDQERLHLQHFLVKSIWQNNFSAPINHILTRHRVMPNKKRLLVGMLRVWCGSGSWSFDIATIYPTINVIGLDISQQLTQTMPKNFTFVQANVLKGIPFENNTFDFVFQRFMAGGYTKDNWPYVMNEIVRVLKPGGFLEMMEASQNYDVGPATRRFWNAQSTFVKQQGIDLNVYQTLEIYPQNQGQLENIKKEVKQIRQGVNSNDIQLNEMAINNLILLIARMKPFAFMSD
ncbi:S-adenosyl-L-methionine-dependent methyltransferase [Gigaspora margarita]|uniref:S-adenosyl-L-methionine-dependent methyltransferase n=1 Tax=Gigaspora margarita TaxID=4874 RepID=A0A8H3XDV8_GIGMA|nr:S-adenosyl-L-methionine-dependent methyltransferase [Gigaspora margarita]